MGERVEWCLVAYTGDSGALGLTPPSRGPRLRPSDALHDWELLWRFVASSTSNEMCRFFGMLADSIQNSVPRESMKRVGGALGSVWFSESQGMVREDLRNAWKGLRSGYCKMVVKRALVIVMAQKI